MCVTALCIPVEAAPCWTFVEKEVSKDYSIYATQLFDDIAKSFALRYSLDPPSLHAQLIWHKRGAKILDDYAVFRTTAMNIFIFLGLKTSRRWKLVLLYYVDAGTLQHQHYLRWMCFGWSVLIKNKSDWRTTTLPPKVQLEVHLSLLESVQLF